MPITPLLTVEDLASYLQKSVKSIRSDVSRNPKSLPPICRLPNTKRLLWRLEDVELWLQKHVAEVNAPAASELSVPSPKRGRPSKSAQVRKSRNLSVITTHAIAR